MRTWISWRSSTLHWFYVVLVLTKPKEVRQSLRIHQGRCSLTFDSSVKVKGWSLLFVHSCPHRWWCHPCHGDKQHQWLGLCAPGRIISSRYCWWCRWGRALTADLVNDHRCFITETEERTHTDETDATLGGSAAPELPAGGQLRVKNTSSSSTKVKSKVMRCIIASWETTTTLKTLVLKVLELSFPVDVVGPFFTSFVWQCCHSF